MLSKAHIDFLIEAAQEHDSTLNLDERDPTYLDRQEFMNSLFKELAILHKDAQ